MRPEEITERTFLMEFEVARIFRVSTRTVRRWALAGKLKRHGPGRTPLYHRDEVLRLMAQTR